jgi:hypothetical protein
MSRGYGLDVRLRLLMLLLLVHSGVAADWKRTVFDGKGGSEDNPQPQTFAYFLVAPPLHDASGDFSCYRCSPEQRLTAAKQWNIRSEIRWVATLNGRKVYDILYFLPNQSKPAWKSVLVQRDGNHYSEIVQVHEISRAGIQETRAEGDGMICLTDNCDRSGCIDGCWRITAQGPVYIGTRDQLH